MWSGGGTARIEVVEVWHLILLVTVAPTEAEELETEEDRVRYMSVCMLAMCVPLVCGR